MRVDIKYPNGRMQVNLEEFFPASQKNCKRLFAIVDMDWQHKDEIIQSIALWVTEEISRCESPCHASRKEKLQRNLVAITKKVLP